MITGIHDNCPTWGCQLSSFEVLQRTVLVSGTVFQELRVELEL